jgi:hypothetical protein
MDETTNQQVEQAPAPVAAPEGEQKLFTQEELNRHINERLTRERGRYQDYEQLKAEAAEFKKLKAAQLSEAEKAQARIQELEAAQADADAKMKALEMAVNERLIKSEVTATAAIMGFNVPADAYALADLSEIAVEEDGSIKGVGKALEALKKSKPYLLKIEDGRGGPGTPPRGQAKPGGGAKPEQARPTIHF